jgi:RNA polymerase sigma-70 factor, ECF subfamily
LSRRNASQVSTAASARASGLDPGGVEGRLSNCGAKSVITGVSGSQFGRDEGLAREMYDDHAVALVNYVQRMMNGDRQTAEDIVQETWLRAWRHADRVPAEARRQWLFVTARNVAIDTYRARKARPAEAGGDAMDAVIDDEGLDAALDTVLLMDALRSLSYDHRSVLFDCYYRGLTAAQIAAAQGLPPGTVRSRIHYALRGLRMALQERGVNA